MGKRIENQSQIYTCGRNVSFLDLGFLRYNICIQQRGQLCFVWHDYADAHILSLPLSAVVI